MNWKTYVPLIAAVGLGLLAAKLARDAVARGRGDETQAPQGVQVVVAKEGVSPGEALTPERLTLAPIAAEAAPPNAFTDPSALSGRVVQAQLVPGQTVLEELLAPVGAQSGIVGLIPKDKRAITVQVDETTGVAGLLTPGCRVDVVATINDADSSKTLARTIVQNVEVRAVGQRLTAKPVNQPPAEGGAPAQPETFRTVTLIVNPQEVEIIELASSSGRPRLVLRGTNDTAIPVSPGVDFRLMKGGSHRIRGDYHSQPVADLTPTTGSTTRPAARETVATGRRTARNRKPQRKVTVIRGSNQMDVYFDGPSTQPTGGKPAGLGNDNDDGAYSDPADPFANPAGPSSNDDGGESVAGTEAGETPAGEWPEREAPVTSTDGGDATRGE